MIRRMREMVQLSGSGSFEAIVFATLSRDLRTMGVRRRAKALELHRRVNGERGLIQRYGETASLSKKWLRMHVGSHDGKT